MKQYLNLIEMENNMINRDLIDEEVYTRLPESLKEITSLFEGREKDIVLLSSLGVLSACLPNVMGMYDRKVVYPPLYILIIAPPASGKGVMNYSRLLIEKIHNKMMTETRQEVKDFEKARKQKRGQLDSLLSAPALKLKILPANISTSEMFSFMESSKHGVLIFESEADTMSNMLKNDWSNYSDVLRKAFHHEPISMARKVEQIFIEIGEPKLSMVMSGTPGQLQPLIKSKENGLFSRLAMYNFNDIVGFKNVFDSNQIDIKPIFQIIGDEVFALYGKLQDFKVPIEVSFNEEQRTIFMGEFSNKQNELIDNHSEDFLSNMHRLGLVMFRIAMILTILRNKDNLSDGQHLVCSQDDFDISLSVTRRLLSHSLYTFNSVDSSYLSILDSSILDELENQFSRNDAVKKAREKGMPHRTLDDKLKQWQAKNIIRRVSKGIYIKQM